MDEVLRYSTHLHIKEAEDKEPLKNGVIYLAPGNYHMLLERDGHLALSVSEQVNFSRPSIDVTFVNIAELYGEKATGIILTGANNDGAFGLSNIAHNGGKTIVQKPDEARVSIMPEAALRLNTNAELMNLNEIAQYLSLNFS